MSPWAGLHHHDSASHAEVVARIIGPVEVIDAQVHVWQRDSPEQPWDPRLRALPAEHLALIQKLFSTHVVDDTAMVAMMDGAGVDAALLVSPSIYGPDNSYALQAAKRYPQRFRVVGRVDLQRSDLDRTLEGWLEQPGMVGARVTANNDSERERLTGQQGDRFLEIAGRNSIPVCVYAPGCLPALNALAKRHRETVFVIDHLGMHQPPNIKPGQDPLLALPDLLAMSQLDNVAVKFSAVPSIAKEPYPFRDVWPVFNQVASSFGIERVLWGTDITRCDHSYEEDVGYLKVKNELTETEFGAVMGSNLRRIFQWE